MEDGDTISALSTPAGEGGIGIIRLSGRQARPILDRIFHRATPGQLSSRRLYLGHIVDPQSEGVLDEVLAVYLSKPHTYTREEMVEIHCHGGFTVQQAILRLTLREGARLAEPGEFTKRAFLNGRIDLLQAESVLDIIESETEAELHHAVDHLSGTLSRRLGAIDKSLRSLLAEVEAGLDFPDEELDLPPVSPAAEMERIADDIRGLIGSYYEGRGIREGFEVLILGRTNVGKSSLLNALLVRDRAIVTPLPGTTRDLIEETIHIRGLKARLIDTAGLRKPADIIEQEGIERVKQKIPRADLVLWVLDSSQAYTPEDAETYELVKDRKTVAVLNKTDLPCRIDKEGRPLQGLSVVETSATTDRGIDALRETIHASLVETGTSRSGVLITHARHRDALERAERALERGLQCLRADEPIEFLALEIRQALGAVGDLTGQSCSDDILNEIFSRFCIGK